MTSLYSDEPWNERNLDNYLVRAQEPFNAEAKLEKLVEHYITPTDRHFRRNHGSIPNLCRDSWRMQVDVDAVLPAKTQLSSSIKLADLTKLPAFEVVAVLECAGNRRDGLKAIKPVNGVIWGPGTASNSRWTGCRLRDLLVSVGVPKDLCHPFYSTPKHVEFAGFGDAKEDKHYASSIPLEWIMNPLNMVLVAYEMNGQPLTRDHGFPARIVAPGIIGARWVKWLKYIRVQDVESDSFYQKLDYKILPPMADAHNCTEFWPKFPALMELNIQSVICRPAPEEELQVGRPFEVQGYAFSGGGRAVDRVEVSLDGGKTWDLARIYTMQTKCKDGQRDWSAKQWAWTLWAYRIDHVPTGCTIACRAWDSGGNTQPSEAVWNYRGVMNNSVYKIKPPVRLESRL